MEGHQIEHDTVHQFAKFFMERKDIWDEPDRSNPYGLGNLGNDSSYSNSVSDDDSSDRSNVLIIKKPPVVKMQAKMSRKESQRSLLASVKGKNTSNLDILALNNPCKVEDVRNKLLSQKFESSMILNAKVMNQNTKKTGAESCASVSRNKTPA